VRELLDELLRSFGAGETAALATVVATMSSAPRSAGAAMTVAADGSVAGSVSGGCVEGDVYELGRQVIGERTPVLRRYGVSDAEAFAVGLTCGGVLDVFVEPVDERAFAELPELAAAVRAQLPVALATVVEHPDPQRLGRHLLVFADRASGGLGSPRVDGAVTDDARGLLATGRSGMLHYGPEGQRRGAGMAVFVTVFEPPPRMIVFGAIDFAAAMARLGGYLGYRVTVCDARPTFATESRFPEVDEVVVDWPHRYLAQEVNAGRVDGRTAVTVLTHDPKFDVPVLAVALRAGLGYVGAMGSRRTHDDRRERLREAGLTEAELGSLSSPIGLDLGARTPEETAVSIAAEIIALRWGGRGDRLVDLAGPIHHAP